LEQNQAHKNMFCFYASARNRAPIFPDRALIFYEWKVSIMVSKSCSDFDSFPNFNFESLFNKYINFW